jgi:uncharacterized protein (TIRG00374 family)
MQRSAAARLAKVVISLSLLVLIVAHVGPGLVLERLREMDVALVIFAFALLIAEALVRALNWYQLIRAGAREVPLAMVIHAHFVGGFFGALLPSTLGTDLARSAIMATRSDAPVETYFATTVLLNVRSLVVISATALIACTFMMHRSGTPLATIALSAAISTACLLAIGAAWLRTRQMRSPGTVAPAQAMVAGVRRRLRQFVAALTMLPQGWNLASVGAVAALSYLLRSLGWLVLLAAAGAPVPWVVLLTIGPLITLGAALPISVLGFGGFQAINVILLMQWGVAPQHALAASLVQSGLGVLLHAIGCVAYLAGGKMVPPTLVADEPVQEKQRLC